MPDGSSLLKERSNRRVSAAELAVRGAVQKRTHTRTFHHAYREIETALRDGRLGATGIPVGHSNLEEIAPTEWAYLDLFEHEGKEIGARVPPVSA